MSPRPRKASDGEVFAAAHRVMARRGPGELKLSDIAREAGVTPGALVQRFGSKRGLLLALTEGLEAEPARTFAGLRAAHPSPLAALRAYAGCMAPMGESPATLAHHLAYLQLDLADPDLHRRVVAQARATRREIHALLDAAVAAGELRPAVDTAALARAVEVTLGGSLLSRAFGGGGSAAEEVRHDLDFLLGPYREG